MKPVEVKNAKGIGADFSLEFRGESRTAAEKSANKPALFLEKFAIADEQHRHIACLGNGHLVAGLATLVRTAPPQLCGNNVSAQKKAQCLRNAFQGLSNSDFVKFSTMAKWGEAMTGITDKASRAKEANAGAAALRGVFALGYQGRMLSVRSSRTEEFADAMMRVQAIKVYQVTATMGILTNAELTAGVNAATRQFGDTGAVVETALDLIETIWKALPAKQKPTSVVDAICKEPLMHQNYVVAEKAADVLVSTIAKDVSNATIQKIIQAMKDRIVNGATYTDVDTGKRWNVHVGSVNSKLRILIAQLQALLLKRQKP